MTAPVIQFKRGLLANLPGLRAGEPGFTTDSYDLYVGIDSTTNNNQFVGSGRFWSVGSASVGSGVKLVEGTNNGTNAITIKAPDSLASDVSFTFPGTDGSNNQVLATDGSGTLSFIDAVATLNIAGDSGTDTVSLLSENLTFSGTSNEVNTAVTNNTVTIGLPDDVTIGQDLTITRDLAIGRNLDVTGNAVFSSTGSIQLPRGTTAQRLSGVLGQVRYNTSLSQFEGYGAGNAWGSLGGVKDVDGDTFIRAESAAGQDEDSLEFLTAGTARVSIDSTGNVGVGTTGGAEADSSNTAVLNVGIVTANNYYGTGGDLKLGPASDGSLTTSGALNTFTTTSSIVNSIDDLNEVAFNIIKNTAVTDVGFTANTTSGAATLNVTLTITSSGNANRFDITWGDGTSTLDTTDSTPSHAYTNSSGGTYNVTVVARNASGVGAGQTHKIHSTQQAGGRGISDESSLVHRR